VQSAAARIVFSTNDPTATAWCSVDGASATTCASPLDLSSLPQGAHTVAIYAVDPAGNVSTSSHVSFTVDNTAPTLSVTTSPPSVIATRTASVAFSTNDPSAVTWCALDGGPAVSCASAVSYSGLADGSHSISLYSVDPAGNRSATKTVSFTVAAGAPTFTSTPPASSSILNSITFKWVAVAGFTYQYSYDGVTWNTTTTSSSNTTPNYWISGSHTFYLRGTDGAGNHTAIATYTFQTNLL
jgi:predicted phage tail protein